MIHIERKWGVLGAVSSVHSPVDGGPEWVHSIANKEYECGADSPTTSPTNLLYNRGQWDLSATHSFFVSVGRQ